MLITISQCKYFAINIWDTILEAIKKKGFGSLQKARDLRQVHGGAELQPAGARRKCPWGAYYSISRS